MFSSACSDGADRRQHLPAMSYPSQCPVLLPICSVFSVRGSVSPHRFPKVGLLSLGLFQGSRNASMSGQQSLFPHRYRAVLTSGKKQLPMGQNGLERTGEVGKN